MAKQKTKKAASKRFTFSSTGKVMHRKIGQAHFNARANGATTRKKHPTQSVHSTDLGRIERLMPHN